ncbi:MAG TPA: glycosyltransferase, partial [Actinotalea sp.]|nr:glycosyltransferase [Actinotalea sp.]
MMPTVYVGALLGRPVSVTLHAADIYLAPPSFARRLSTVDQVVTVCDYNVDRIAALGVPRERIAVVPCGVDVDVPVVPIADPLLVVSVGRLVAKKGYDVLLPAFREVVDRVPGARLEIVGEGPEQDAVHALATELGLDDHVTFLGARPHAESLARIADAAVFTLACRISENGDSDAMPVSLREAMVRARPVVTTAVAGIPENVDDEVGWVVPPGDVDALADALVEALTDRSEAERRALAARRRQVAHYSLERSAATLATLWAHVVGRRS